MRLMLIAAVFLGLVICPNSLHAGLYNPAEPGENLFHLVPGKEIKPAPIGFPQFLNTLNDLRSIGMEQVSNDNPVRMRCVLVADSAPRSVPSTWPASQRLALSAYLIRRQKYSEAIEILKPLARKGENFLALSNLASAYQLAGQEPRLAIENLNQALVAWPRAWEALDKNMEEFLGQIGWDRKTFLWYREADKYQQKLLRLRAGEDPGIKGKRPEKLDALFDVNFVGDSGKYEAGTLAAKEKAKLPANALAVVQQLLLWLPDDPRLFWHLGELYNAQGDVATALQIFNSKELAGFNGGFRAPELVEHLNILRTAPLPKTKLIEDPEKPSPTGPKDEFQIDWRALLVGFAVGVVMTFLAYWQIRELQRRRQRAGK